MKKIFCLIFSLFIFVGFTACGNPNPSNEEQVQEKNVTIEVAHKDESVEKFEITSSEKYLGDALEKEKIIEGKRDMYGLFVMTADDETADSKNEEWWCITKDNEPVMTGISSTPFEDGDKFELTFTTGYGKQ